MLSEPVKTDVFFNKKSSRLATQPLQVTGQIYYKISFADQL